MSLRLYSPWFENGQRIPRRFTVDGADESPALAWIDPPAGTRSFVIVCSDPDVDGREWTHWLVYNLPATARRVENALPRKKLLDDQSRQGFNDFGQIGYCGPCPPPGELHRYVFRLLAVRVQLEIFSSLQLDEVRRAIHGSVLSAALLMGKYSR